MQSFFKKQFSQDKQKQIIDENNVKQHQDEQLTDKKQLYIKNYPLHYAVAQGDLDKVKGILQSKTVGVNSKDHNEFTPLHVATGRENYEMVVELLRHLADPNAEDGEGNTPLHFVAEGNNLRILKCLLKNKYGNKKGTLTKLIFAIGLFFTVPLPE